MTTNPTVPFPTSPYCRVRARVASIWADGPDNGTHPDWRPAAGEKVTLTPSIGSQLLTYDVAGPEPIIVTVERVECVVDEDGWLAKSDGRPVYIAPTDDPLLSATGWTWTASIKGKSIPFSARSGGVVDLALYVATPAVNAPEYVSSVVQIVANYLTENPPDFAKGGLAPRSLDTLYDPGVYRLNGRTDDYAGAPPIAGTTLLQGQLTVLGAPGATWAAQDFIRYHAYHWERWWRTSSNTSGGWGRWQRAITSEPIYIQPPNDIDTYRVAGLYEVRTAAHASQMSNLPVALPGTLLVTATSTEIIHQTYYANADPIPWVRALAGVGSSTWLPWRQLLGGSRETPMVDVGLRNTLLIQDWTRRMGGPTPITAKAAIALRFDHGLNNFRDTILPILRSYGWSSTQVMNSRTWTRGENSSVTPAELDSWVDVEVVNHGATHTDAPTIAELEDEIVTGLAELRAQLPSKQIDGWAPPGVTGSRYMGYNGGGVQELMSTHAGHLILANHAWASGYQAGSLHRVLDGVVRHGLTHTTADKATLSQFQSYINNAIAAEAGLCIMMHPSLLDAEGYMTTATLTSALAFLRTKEQAGDVQIVTLGQLNWAKRSET